MSNSCYTFDCNSPLFILRAHVYPVRGQASAVSLLAQTLPSSTRSALVVEGLVVEGLLLVVVVVVVAFIERTCVWVAIKGP